MGTLTTSSGVQVNFYILTHGKQSIDLAKDGLEWNCATRAEFLRQAISPVLAPTPNSAELTAVSLHSAAAGGERRLVRGLRQ